MPAGHVLLGNFLGTGLLNAIFATLLLIFVVGLSLSLGVLASYWVVRVILHAFGTRARSVQPVVAVERARAAAAGD